MMAAWAVRACSLWLLVLALLPVSHILNISDEHSVLLVRKDTVGNMAGWCPMGKHQNISLKKRGQEERKEPEYAMPTFKIKRAHFASCGNKAGQSVEEKV